MLKQILFLTFSILTGVLPAQNLNFYKENITMKIEGDYFYVTGSYHLKNSGQERNTLAYPYPIDPQYGEVDSLFIFNLTEGEIIEPLYNKKSGAVFILESGATAEIVLQISYRQKILSNRAEYILTSTISWGKPLEKADYQLIIPKDLNMTFFSITPDESVTSDNEKIFYWSKEYYMPDRNMIFEFER